MFIVRFCLKTEINISFYFQRTLQIESDNIPSQAIVELHRITVFDSTIKDEIDELKLKTN
jgi:hypothetical protein